ncbi:nuclear migration protein nudC [Perkinsela sp. CCAP 1560/4]|nr:nuclear migration protein nudC [Perkinsela sp. CCAP 1560/4]|eukprot:KNH05425.1 nuclear migration protein nudC [Perkinsela sp. CCAP 1560/4]
MVEFTQNKENLFDGVLLGMAQRHSGGIDDFLDTFFSFLVRKTDLFGRAEMAKSTLVERIDQSIIDYQNIQSEKQQEREVAKARFHPVPENRVEVVDDEPTEPCPVPSPPTQSVTPGDSDSPIAPSTSNGADYGSYSFTQTLAELEVRIPLPRTFRSKELLVEINADRVSVKARVGDAIFLSGPLVHRIRPSESMWTLDNGVAVCLQLAKQNQQEWWKTVIQGDRAIDLSKVCPENSKLDDLDGETRQTVEKMMYDQRRKQMGLPSSEDEKKNEMLKKFMAAHPEMDFSNAKIS